MAGDIEQQTGEVVVAVYTETIQLEDKVSAPARSASKELVNLTTQMLTAQDATKKKQDQDAKTTAQKAASTATKEATKKATELANTMATVRDAVGSSVAGMKSAFTSLAAGDVTGAIGGVTDSVASMAKLLDLAVPGLGQAAAVVVQVAGGLVGITAGLIKSGVEFAIASSEAKQQMLGLFDAMGGGVTTGAQTEEMIDGLKAKFGIAKDSLIGYTNELQRMGMTDLGEIEGSLLAVASASALVKGGDQALLSFTKKIELAKEAGVGLKIPIRGLAALSATGANVGDVAKEMGVSVETLTKNLTAGTVDAAKFGNALQTAIITKGKGPLEKMASSSANLKKLLSEAWGDLFEDIDVGPFMAEVKKLFDIFGQGTKSGEALKSGIGGFFKQVFATLTKVVPMAKHFLLDLVIYGLKAYLALKPIVTKVKEFAESATGAKVLGAVMSSLWTVLKVVALTIVGLVAVALVLWGAMIAVSVAVWTVVGAVTAFLGDAAAGLTEWATGAASAAANFIAGLVQGISAGATQVTGAVSGVAESALGAFTSALGIASPSKVMMQMGGHMTDGVAEGLEDGTSDVHGASSGVADASVKGMQAGASGAASGGGGGGGSPITVQIQIDGAGKSAMEITEEMVSQCFQRMALEAGL